MFYYHYATRLIERIDDSNCWRGHPYIKITDEFANIILTDIFDVSDYKSIYYDSPSLTDAGYFVKAYVQFEINSTSEHTQCLAVIVFDCQHITVSLLNSSIAIPYASYVSFGELMSRLQGYVDNVISATTRSY